MEQPEPGYQDIWAAGRGGRGRHRRRFGRGGHHGMGGDDDIRAGRILAQGDIRLIMLALIAEQPRHGYEIIKLIEEKTESWYSPSPGIVYPTLTYLEEAGYVTAQAEGAKKLYSITAEGRAHLKENRDFVDLVLDRLAAIGARFGRMRRLADEGDEERRGSKLPPLVRAALDNLRVIAADRLGRDAETEAKIVDVLARAAAELRRT
ncbi:MAG: PadR family transcriptional regulator [Rhizobiales bacterium]|nr:PadR family transcriptional regulator [Hyphomicrobiales bacterium]